MKSIFFGSKEKEKSVHNGSKRICQRCESNEYLKNEEHKVNRYCGNCGQKLNWTVNPKAEEVAEIVDNTVKHLIEGGWA